MSLCPSLHPPSLSVFLRHIFTFQPRSYALTYLSSLFSPAWPQPTNLSVDLFLSFLILLSGIPGIWVRILQRQNQWMNEWMNKQILKYINIYTEIYYEVLAHMTAEAEKSHNLPPASWRPRKANGIVQKPESQKVDDDIASSLCLKAWEPGAPRAKYQCPSSLSQEESEFNLPPRFALFRPSD